MLRLSTPDFKRFVQADTFDITYGGGEANVAAALCNYGLNGTFVTKFQTMQSARQLSTTFVVME
jgi:2-dehydro-3-deoxygluconokinase